MAGREETSLFLLAPVVLDQILCLHSPWEFADFQLRNAVTQVG